VKNVQVEIVQRWPVKAYAGGAIVATLPDPSKATMRKAISRLFTLACTAATGACQTQGVCWAPSCTSDEGRKNEMSTPMPPPPPGATPPRRSFWRRPIGIVLLAFVALVVLGGILSALGERTEETAASPKQEPSVEPEETVEAQERVVVPPVVGKRFENAKDALRRADLRVSVVLLSVNLRDDAPLLKISRKHPSKLSGRVLSQSVSAGTEVRPGRTIRLVVSAGPKPRPSPMPNCTSGYSPCLVNHSGADYDCYGGSGDGPYYTEPGVVYTVSGSDPYGLDADNDGSGCEP
jgi:hypothetical protein